MNLQSCPLLYYIVIKKYFLKYFVITIMECAKINEAKYFAVTENSKVCLKKVKGDQTIHINFHLFGTKSPKKALNLFDRSLNVIRAFEISKNFCISLPKRFYKVINIPTKDQQKIVILDTMIKVLRLTTILLEIE